MHPIKLISLWKDWTSAHFLGSGKKMNTMRLLAFDEFRIKIYKKALWSYICCHILYNSLDSSIVPLIGCHGLRGMVVAGGKGKNEGLRCTVYLLSEAPHPNSQPHSHSPVYCLLQFELRLGHGVRDWRNDVKSEIGELEISRVSHLMNEWTRRRVKGARCRIH